MKQPCAVTASPFIGTDASSVEAMMHWESNLSVGNPVDDDRGGRSAGLGGWKDLPLAEMYLEDLQLRGSNIGSSRQLSSYVVEDGLDFWTICPTGV